MTTRPASALHASITVQHGCIRQHRQPCSLYHTYQHAFAPSAVSPAARLLLHQPCLLADPAAASAASVAATSNTSHGRHVYDGNLESDATACMAQRGSALAHTCSTRWPVTTAEGKRNVLMLCTSISGLHIYHGPGWCVRWHACGRSRCLTPHPLCAVKAVNVLMHMGSTPGHRMSVICGRDATYYAVFWIGVIRCASCRAARSPPPLACSARVSQGRLPPPRWPLLQRPSCWPRLPSPTWHLPRWSLSQGRRRGRRGRTDRPVVHVRSAQRVLAAPAALHLLPATLPRRRRSLQSPRSSPQPVWMRRRPRPMLLAVRCMSTHAHASLNAMPLALKHDIKVSLSPVPSNFESQ